jgi:hypothetical protein
MFKSIQHDDKLGPRSSRYSGDKGEDVSIDMAPQVPKPTLTANGATRPEPYQGT